MAAHIDVAAGAALTGVLLVQVLKVRVFAADVHGTRRI
jgi:hypothetical protein